MKKPDNVYEFDGYTFPEIPKNPNPITKEEEDRLIAAMVERIKKIKARQDAKEAQRALENETQSTVSISVSAVPGVSIMENSR
ncbi:MAG: hypothetical protein NC078_05580 [Ruminococcus sp.]|nr:hypothetical protein [Ruminococcus sp.]